MRRYLAGRTARLVVIALVAIAAGFIGIVVSAQQADPEAGTEPLAQPTAAATLEDAVLECIRKLQESGATEGYCGGRRVPEAERLGDPSRVPAATPYPTPSLSRAMAKANGERALGQVPGIADVLAALRNRDVDALLALTERTTRTCPDRAQSVTYSKQACESLNGAIDGRFEAVGFEWSSLLSVKRARSALAEALAAGPVDLALAARDTRASSAGTHYLYFATQPYTTGEAGLSSEALRGIGLVLTAGSARPVRAFWFLPPSNGPLFWLQLLEPQHQELILPATLDGFTPRPPG